MFLLLFKNLTYGIQRYCYCSPETDTFRLIAACSYFVAHQYQPSRLPFCRTSNIENDASTSYSPVVTPFPFNLIGITLQARVIAFSLFT